MTYAQALLPEFDEEMANTRKVLEILPDDKLDWRASANCNTIGWVANHIADIPMWADSTLNSDSFDFAPVGGQRYQLPNLKSRQEIVALFDKNVASARAAIANVKDEDIDQMWSLLEGGKVFLTMPRRTVMRNFVMNHLIHHRAYLLAYLRMLNLPVPGMYGPADPV